mmetsp:Transcript_75218/g.213918  ORF Transcript_75218/g.213918 Transcript_75218/m.213918 type:complete len:218 (+) Transcript_75218:239-892(+)
MPSTAEVHQHRAAVVVNQDVVRLHVPVREPARVHGRQRLDGALQYSQQRPLIVRPRRPYPRLARIGELEGLPHGVEHGAILKNREQELHLGRLAPLPRNLYLLRRRTQQRDHIRMLRKHLEHLELRLGVGFGLVRLAHHALESEALVAVALAHDEDLAEASLRQLLDTDHAMRANVERRHGALLELIGSGVHLLLRLVRRLLEVRFGLLRHAFHIRP